MSQARRLSCGASSCVSSGPDAGLAPTGQVEVFIVDPSKVGETLTKRINIENGVVNVDAYVDGYVSFSARISSVTGLPTGSCMSRLERNRSNTRSRLCRPAPCAGAC